MTATFLAHKPPDTQYAEPTVFVVDDDVDIRKSIALLARSVNLNVRSFSTARELLDSLTSEDHGCLVVDVRMPGMSGLELQKELSMRRIGIPIIMVSAHGELSLATQAMRAGALDFIQKPFSRQTLLDRIHQALEINGKNCAEHAWVAKLSARKDTLSDREREVKALLIKGANTKQIARELNISPKTVDNHRAKVLEKMGVESVPELILLVLGPPAS